jgi:hypothetical protein
VEVDWLSKKCKELGIDPRGKPWLGVKYDDICLKERAGIPDLRAGLREWFERYNMWRPHAALGNQTPAVVHLEARKEKEKEAEVISGPMPPECGRRAGFCRLHCRSQRPFRLGSKNRSTGLSICSDTRLRLYGDRTLATIA